MDRLSSLQMGEWGVIEGFAEPELPSSAGDSGSSEAAQRASLIATLMKLGLVPGAQLKLAARGFGGDPLAVDVRGGRVALGRSEADCILVTRTVRP